MPDAQTLAPWLDEVRATAASQFAQAEAPSGVDEVWRYSRIADIDLHAYTAVSADAGSDIDAIGIDGAAATIVIRDGRIVSLDRTDALGKATVNALVDDPNGEALFNSVRGEAIDAVAHLHDANLGDVVVIDVPRGHHVEAPIVIDVYSDVEGGLTCPHTIVRAANGASVAVFERRRSGSADQLVVPVVELDAAPDARVGYLVAQQLGVNTNSLEHHVAQSDQQAHVICSVAAFGGSYARTRAVYSGLIKVAETAPGTNAFQTNRNLKLSEAAWAYSVPNLEIEQNQVSCSHASTVGEIDEDQRFYLESRGVPTAADRAAQEGRL